MKTRILLLVFVPVLLQFGIAHADNRNSVFFGAGVAKPEGIDTTLYLTAGGRWEFHEGWAIDPDFGYWRADSVERQCPSPGCAVYDLRDIHVGGSLIYIGAFHRVDLYLGGGAAAHFRDRIVNLPPGSTKNPPELSSTRLGLQYVSGADIPISGSFGLALGLRGDFIFREDPLDNQFVFAVHGGIRYYFP